MTYQRIGTMYSIKMAEPNRTTKKVARYAAVIRANSFMPPFYHMI